jgi:hypothetical protein
MDDLVKRRDPQEIELGRAVLALTAILDQEMDAIFRNLLDDIASAPTLERHRATAANRIVLLCRNLADQIRQYEHLRGLADAAGELSDDDFDF